MAKIKYILDVVVTTEKPEKKKDIKAAVERALVGLYTKVRVRTVDED